MVGMAKIWAHVKSRTYRTWSPRYLEAVSVKFRISSPVRWKTRCWRWDVSRLMESLLRSGGSVPFMMQKNNHFRSWVGEVPRGVVKAAEIRKGCYFQQNCGFGFRTQTRARLCKFVAFFKYCNICFTSEQKKSNTQVIPSSMTVHMTWPAGPLAWVKDNVCSLRSIITAQPISVRSLWLLGSYNSA
jgi:hypothetical protein